jgi:hypothetical protein
MEQSAEYRESFYRFNKPALREDAQAVIDRWFTPKWNYTHDATGELIDAVREALREDALVCLSETHQQLGEQLGEVGPKIGEQFGEDIIGMVRKACDPDKVDAWQNGFWVLTQTELERFAALVAAAEREACARVCRDLGRGHGVAFAEFDCVEAIRARGKE